MFRVPERLYRTESGRLVRHGDPEAAFLAFPVGHELSDEEAERLGVTAFYETLKARSVPIDNKMAARPADKSAVKVLTSKGSET